MTRTLLDTSFFIAVERRDLQALERFSELLEADDDSTAISAVTLTELLASTTLSPQRRAFYEKLRLRFAVLPVTEDAALAGVAAARRGGAKAPDVMIAGVALEHGLRVLTADADFARLIGDAADVLRAS